MSRLHKEGRCSGDDRGSGAGYGLGCDQVRLGAPCTINASRNGCIGALIVKAISTTNRDRVKGTAEERCDARTIACTDDLDIFVQCDLTIRQTQGPVASSGCLTAHPTLIRNSCRVGGRGTRLGGETIDPGGGLITVDLRQA